MTTHRTLLLTIALSILAACGNTDSPEQQVRAVIEEMETAAEARDVSALADHLSSEYRDLNGSSADEATRYARGYFIANQSIHLLTRIEQIEFPFPDEARVQVLVGMLGRDVANTSNWDLAADLVEFKLALRREDDEWKVSFAEWSRR